MFNGKSSLDYFTFTKSISRPFLPPISVPSVLIPNRAGAVALRKNEIGIREFSIGVALVGLNNGDLRTKIRALAEFLIYDEDKELYFSDEPNRIYYARFTGSSNDLEELIAIGEGEIILTAFDPFAYSNVTKELQAGAQQFVITNEGSIEAFPIFRIITAGNVPFIKIRNITTNKQFIYIEQWLDNVPLIVDMDKNLVINENTGEILMRNVALESDFFDLAKGDNTIKIETNDLGTAAINNVRANWKERFY